MPFKVIALPTAILGESFCLQVFSNFSNWSGTAMRKHKFIPLRRLNNMFPYSHIDSAGSYYATCFYCLHF